MTLVELVRVSAVFEFLPFFVGRKKPSDGTSSGNLPKTWRVAPPPACLTTDVGDGFKRLSNTPSARQVLSDMQLKKVFPVSTNPTTGFDFELIWKIVFTCNPGVCRFCAEKLAIPAKWSRACR